ncbi:hypothetical protein ACFUEN_29010 [Streptomyces griseorubiginosus]
MPYLILCIGIAAAAVAAFTRMAETRQYALAAVIGVIVLEVICWGPR